MLYTRTADNIYIYISGHDLHNIGDNVIGIFLMT